MHIIATRMIQEKIRYREMTPPIRGIMNVRKSGRR